jgi:hypothetical protein
MATQLQLNFPHQQLNSTRFSFGQTVEEIEEISNDEVEVCNEAERLALPVCGIIHCCFNMNLT